MSKNKKNPYAINYFGDGVAVIPRAVIRSERYRNLNFAAKSLLVEIAVQYTGYNNGDLCATRSLLKDFGFNSQDTLTRALKELEKNELIEKTRIGGKNYFTGANEPNLYALTWQPIDKCLDQHGGNKLDTPFTIKPRILFPKRPNKLKIRKPRTDERTMGNRQPVYDGLKTY